MTLREIIYNIGDIPRGGLQSNTEPLSDRLKAFIILGTRASLIKRELDKSMFWWDFQLEQRFKCIDVKQVPAYECCDLRSDCKVLRTCEPLPKIIIGRKRPGISYVGSIDSFSEYGYVAPDRVKWAVNDPITGDLPKYTIINSYVYLINDDETEKIEVRSMYEDPITASNQYACGDCLDWDSPFPLPASLLDALKKEIYSTDITALLKGVPDDTNNSTPNR